MIPNRAKVPDNYDQDVAWSMVARPMASTGPAFRASPTVHTLVEITLEVLARFKMKYRRLRSTAAR